MTINVRMVVLIMPPTIGAAMRFMTLAPVPLPKRMGSRPAMMAVTVIMSGRTRSTPPSMTATYRSRSVGRPARATRAFHA